MSDISWVYLDSTVLYESHWPQLSASLLALLELCRAYGTQVVVPEPVCTEREHQWRRKLVEQVHSVRQARQNLRSFARDIIKPEEDDREPVLIEEALRAYRERVTEVTAKFSIVSCGYPKKHVTELFEMAAARQPPFQETKDKVTGFQDTVILFSVLEHLAHYPGKLGILVSRDRIFDQIQPLSAEIGVRLQVVKSADEAVQLFKPLVDTALTSWWEKDEAEAIKALNKRLDDATAYVCDQLNVPTSRNTWSIGLRGLVGTIERVTVRTVLKARTPLPKNIASLNRERWLPPFARLNGESVRITYTIETELFGGLRVPRASLQGLQAYRQGTTLEVPELYTVSEFGTTLMVDLDVQAVYLDGVYTLEEFTSAEVFRQSPPPLPVSKRSGADGHICSGSQVQSD